MATAEIVSIGTELLLGQILDTNSQFLAAELANLGVDCLFRSTVGDNTARIISTVKFALDRSDIVITTGGLGPTADDLTHECFAELFGVDMVFDAGVLEFIENLFRKRGMHMVESNKKQANRPRGADILPNPVGTAPGIIWSTTEEQLKRAGIQNPERSRYIFTFPGVPAEMKPMWQQTAAPFIAKVFGQGIVWSRELKHYGIGESTLAEKYAELLNGVNPTVAPLAGTGECRLRVSAKATTADEAEKIAMSVIQQILTGSGHLCYGFDQDNLETVVGRLLKEKNLTVAAAESCTGGLVSKRLTDVAGSSAYVKLNLVTYANEAKQAQLGVRQATLEQHGAVSAECAKEMAEGVRKVACADIGISVTGIAGPDGGSAEKPVGLVFFGLSGNGKTYVWKGTFPEQIGRDSIRNRSASDALNMLRLFLLDPALVEKKSVL